MFRIGTRKKREVRTVIVNLIQEGTELQQQNGNILMKRIFSCKKDSTESF